MTHQSHQQVAALLREQQTGYEAELDQTFAAEPERLAVEKAAFQLTYLLYDNFSAEIQFVVRGQDLRPTVTAIHRDSPFLADSELAQHAPLLFVAFGHAPEIYREIERVLLALRSTGVAEREPFMSETGVTDESLAQYIDSYFSFRQFPVILGGLVLHGTDE